MVEVQIGRCSSNVTTIFHFARVSSFEMNPFIVIFQLLSRRGAEVALITLQRSARMNSCNVFQQIASGGPSLCTMGTGVLDAKVNRLFMNPDRFFARIVGFVIADVTLD